MGDLLKAVNVCKNFAGLKALSDVSLEIHDDEVFGLIGPNGAGKTTFFNAISGFSAPSSGEVYFCGKNMTNKKTYEYANEGLARTFQNIRVFSAMTVLDNVMVGMHKNIHTDFVSICLNLKKQKRADAEAREKAMEILKFLKIDCFANETAGNLPYGTQRLVEVGRALASNPRLLLLDEPTAGMNQNETMELMELIQEIRKLGPAVMVIEHNMKFMMNLCDRIAVLNFGELITVGKPQEVQLNPQVIDAYLGKEEE